ncbi:Transcription termination protein NusB [hydrothermal vent metagenome]|uniref:Transcription termination protein NusB n=1 Tax=hydrothermal vent metagenome TaxID=652676 RepID=A0A3B0YY19_9ZZZZ
MMDPKLLNARRQARRLGMQAIYQWLMADTDLNDLEAQFKAQDESKRADLEYFHELIFKVAEHSELISAILVNHTSIPLNEIDPVERSVLLVAIYELKFRLDIPFKVVINEAVGLAKKFGAEEGHKFVNGILDKVAHELRVLELQATR